MTVEGHAATARYDRVSAAIHWLTTLLILVAIPVIFIAEEADRETGLQLVFFHKSLGITVLGLTVLRIIWRIGHPAPALPPMPALQVLATKAVHLGLYALMLGLPVTGYMLSSKSPFPLMWFGVELPKLGIPEATAEAANEVHEVLGFVAIALIVLHFAAALYHQFGMRDQLLQRMSLRR